MSKNEDGSGSATTPRGYGAPKRPHATVDATATEIVDENAARAAGPAQSSHDSGTVVAGTAPAAPSADPPSEPQSPPEPVRGNAAADRHTPRPPSSGGGVVPLLTHLTAGAIGGGLLLLALQVLPADVMRDLGISAGGGGSADRLERRLATLERAMPLNADAAGDQKLAAANERLGKIEAELGGVAELREAQGKLVTDTAELGRKLDQENPASRLLALEQQIAAIASAASADPQNSIIPEVAAMASRLSALDKQLGELQTRFAEQPAEPAAVKDVQAALAAVQQTLGDATSAASRLEQTMGTVIREQEQRRQAVAGLQDSLPALKSAIDAVSSRLDTELKAALTDADMKAALEPVGARVAATEKRLAEVVSADDSRRESASRILLALELSSLKRAVENGEPYKNELEAVREAGNGKWDLAALERYAGSTVPTLSELQKSFRAVANAMMDAGSGTADGGVLDRFLDGARSIVRVRRTDHGASDKSVEAVVGRMAEGIRSGQLSAVLAEAANLPEPSARAGAQWLDQASARYAIDQAVAKIETELKASLAGGGAPGADRSQ